MRLHESEHSVPKTLLELPTFMASSAHKLNCVHGVYAVLSYTQVACCPGGLIEETINANAALAKPTR